MILCISGPKLSGKKTLVNYLQSIGYKLYEFDENLCERIMNERLWTEEIVVILPNIQAWKYFQKRPFSKLIVIIAASTSEWRIENDDHFMHAFLKEIQNKRITKYTTVMNYGTVQDMIDSLNLQKLQIRPDLNTYYMNIAFAVSMRGNCMKLNVGAVIVKGNRIIATGYNGTPTGMLNCYEGGCERCNSNTKCGVGLKYCMCIHAEESALLNIGLERCQGSHIYVTHFPCQLCFRKIVQMGIKKVFYREKYSIKDENVIKYFENASIETYQIP